MTVDVVIPAYNAMRFLPHAIDSVLAQTHADLRLYVVDDGSTDETATFVRALTDPRVEYVWKENGGQATARNQGIRHSSSAYVAFLDADDYWYPDKLASQLEVMERHDDAGLVHGFHDIVDDTDAVIGHLEHDLRGWVFDRLLDGNLVNGSGSMVLVRRAVLEDVGLFRDDFLIGEDWEMWLRIARSYRFELVPRRIMAIRQHGEGMQRDRIRMANGRVHMFEAMSDSLALGSGQRRRVAVACLAPAAYDYALAERPRTALTIFGRLLRTAPLRTIRLRAFRFYLWVLVMAVKERRR